MKILKIQQLKYKIKVVPEEGEPLYLDPETVFKFGLRKNDEIDNPKVVEILEYNQFLECKHTAFRLLTRRLHSRKELINKLVVKEYSREIAEKVANHLGQQKFLDDENFAEIFIKQRIAKKYGFNRIKAELFEKGIEKTVITHFELLYSQDKKIESSAQNLAEKKLKEIKRKETDKLKIKAKLYNYLAKRGFNSDLIRETLDTLLQD